MNSYRCFFLNASNTSIDQLEFESASDGEALRHAEARSQALSAAEGYSLWRSGRLVVERLAGAPAPTYMHAQSPEPC